MAAIFFDTTTQLAANGTFIGGTAGNGGIAGAGNATGQAREVGQAIDGNLMNRFGAAVNSDQAGTLYIDGSFDNLTWRQQGSLAVVAGTPGDLSLPLRYRYYRVRYVNGATITGVGNFAIHSSFTAN